MVLITRLSMLELVDRLIVMEGGRIVRMVEERSVAPPARAARAGPNGKD
ncbi:MAG: hypothetical protein ACLSHC_11425 [Bilophila wadsworthia]